jgi:hypothetical protein
LWPPFGGSTSAQGGASSRLTICGMPALADATLDERQRKLLDRFVSALREQ